MEGVLQGGKTVQVTSSFITIDRIFLPDIATVVFCVAVFQKLGKTKTLSENTTKRIKLSKQNLVIFSL